MNGREGDLQPRPIQLTKKLHKDALSHIHDEKPMDSTYYTGMPSWSR